MQHLCQPHIPMLQSGWHGGSVGGGGAQGWWDSQGRKGRFNNALYQLILTILRDWIFDQFLSVFIFLLIVLIFYSTVNKIEKITVTNK